MAASDAKKARLDLPQLRLNNGASMPACGLGTWKSGPGEVKAAVAAALECGYRHIDCASIYGNEGEVGAAFKETSVPRKDIFVTSKLWNTAHSAADVEPACRDSLKKLELDYLDLYLIHWPVCCKQGAPMPPGKDDFTDVPVEETWRAMEALVEKGLVKAIGFSNFGPKRIQQVLDIAKVKPAVLQIEAHPYLPQTDFKAFCDKNGIVITGYAPLGSPDRPARVLDESDPVLLEDKVLAEIAAAAGRPPADVLLRWAVQRGTVVIPKSVTPARIKSNLAATCTPLSEDAMAALAKMDRSLRLLKGGAWIVEEGPIQSLEDFWA